jgi:hypothetical protein
MRVSVLAAVGVAGLLVGASHVLAASPIVAGFNTTTFLANDDGSYPTNGSNSGTPPGTPVAQTLGFTVDYFGTNYSNIFINNNGNLTFANYLSEYTPTDLTTNTGIPIVAPFFADVDTRTGNLVNFGTGTINQTQVGGGTHAAFGVNWPGVGYFSENTDKLDTFQVLLIDRSDVAPGDFDIEFNYGSMQWETGDASGGTDGLGGTSAYVGYSAGTGVAGTFAQLTGSGVPGSFIDGGPDALDVGTNDGVPGQYLFLVQGGLVTTPPPTPTVPLPSAATSGLVMLGGLGLLATARKYWARLSA